MTERYSSETLRLMMYVLEDVCVNVGRVGGVVG